MPAQAMLQSGPENPPTLDQAMIARYRQRRPILLITLVDAFLAEGRGYFRDLLAAVGVTDRNGVRLAAHGLKSSSLNMGAARLAQICLQVEQAAMTAERASLSAAVAAVGTALTDSEQALAGLRAEIVGHQAMPAVLATGAR